MPRPSNPQTQEAWALTRAIDAAETTKARIADKLDVTPGLISQYASGNRPVPWDRAEEIAALAQIAPEDISVEFRRIKARFGPSQAQRLEASIILRTVELVHDTLKELGKPYVGPEEDPQLFVEMLRLAILEQGETGDGERGVWEAGGSSRRASGSASEAEDGNAKGLAADRKRKRAQTGVRGLS